MINDFKVGNEVIAYNKSKGVIKDLGEIGCLITFKDKSHHVQYPDIKKSPHQELLDLGFEVKVMMGEDVYVNEDHNISFLDGRCYVFERSEHVHVGISLQLAKILVRYLEELE